MKLLLTSNGISNESIASALEELVGKPRKEIKIAFIPTAAFADQEETGESKHWLANDLYRIKEFCGFLDIVSLSDISTKSLIKRLEYSDVIFVGGGNTFYLSYCMQKAGLFEALPKLLESRVYAGISAGSMLATATLRSYSQAIENAQAFNNVDLQKFSPKNAVSLKSLHLVNFAIRPHLNKFKFGKDNTFLEKIAEDIHMPLYAIDDSTALKVADDKVEVITEGTWQLIDAV